MAPTKRATKKQITQRRGIVTVILTATVLLTLVYAALRFQRSEELMQEPDPVMESVQTEPTASVLPANPFTEADFTYREDGYLTCTAADTMLGVDVSAHQQDIDWQRVKDAGMEFAMIRVGYRGYSQGTMHLDTYGQTNLEQAREAGLLVGVYYYSQAVSPEEARKEAKWVVELLKDQKLDLPVVYDWEYVSPEARTGAMNRQQVTDCALAFCEEIAAAGFQPMVYFNQDLAENRLDLTAVSDFPFWLAQYEDALTVPYAVSMWQYTSKGTVAGIQGNVDLNLFFWKP